MGVSYGQIHLSILKYVIKKYFLFHLNSMKIDEVVIIYATKTKAKTSPIFIEHKWKKKRFFNETF